jgi:NADPH2:quinone reductase
VRVDATTQNIAQRITQNNSQSDGMSAAKFELHNLDVLLRGIEIKSYVYRYFFTPPRPDETEELNEIAAASFHFKVPVGGLNRLDEFKRAVTETLNHPERGKQFFAN